jgi:hypothetical protein
MQGQESDEETQPILWTEWPTGALAGASSLWLELNMFDIHHNHH